MKISEVKIDETYLVVTLQDGRIISTPISWYPVLAAANKEQRNSWQLCGGGFGIAWPNLNEHLNSEGMLQGRRSRYTEINHDILLVQ